MSPAATDSDMRLGVPTPACCRDAEWTVARPQSGETDAQFRRPAGAYR